MLNSPSNPSGAVYTAEEYRALAAVLERHPSVWIISDDMYEHVLFDGRSFATLRRRRRRSSPRARSRSTACPRPSP